jgi:hypothetical protein
MGMWIMSRIRWWKDNSTDFLIVRLVDDMEILVLSGSYVIFLFIEIEGLNLILSIGELVLAVMVDVLCTESLSLKDQKTARF